VNLGKLAVQAIREWNPFGPAAYQRRDENKAYRKARRKFKRGETLTADEYEILQTYKERPMAIDTGLRTSTNTVVGTSVVGSIAVKLIELLPYPELVAALTTPEAVILWGSVIAWVVARFSKTPAQPKAL
jgi:hypothetical protein